MALNTGVPANQIVNLVNVCVDQEIPRDNPDCCPSIILAPMLNSGTSEPGISRIVTTYESAVEYFGAGSIAADMARFYFLNNPTGDLFITGLEDTGSKAKAKLTLSGSATENSIYAVQVGDTYYSSSVFEGDGPEEILSTISNSINADVDSFFTSSYASNTLTFTMKNSGSFANDLSIITTEDDDIGIASGLTETTKTSFSGGSGDYDLESALNELGDCCYDFFAIPFTDKISWSRMETELQVRWNCAKLIGGHWYAPKAGTFDDLVTLQPGYVHGSITGSCLKATYAPWQKVAGWVGRGHLITCDNPARRWAGPINGIRCDKNKCGDACFSDQERNLLALNSISVSKCGNTNFEEIQLTVTAADFALDQVGFFPQNYYSTMRFVRELKDFIEDRFANSLIKESLEDVPDGSNAVTIPIIVGEIAQWAELTQSDLIDNSSALSDFLRIEIDDRNPYQINMIITIDLINAIRTFAIKVQPRLTINANI